MEIRGPCFYPIKNGEPFNKYEVLASETTPKGIITDKYYFDSKDDAELYLRFLLQEDGLKSINKTISSPRTYIWEKNEYKAFKASIDWGELRFKVKNLRFTKETTFVPMRPKNGKNSRTDNEEYEI